MAKGVKEGSTTLDRGWGMVCSKDKKNHARYADGLDLCG
jgi:hypothetical protein